MRFISRHIQALVLLAFAVAAVSATAISAFADDDTKKSESSGKIVPGAASSKYFNPEAVNSTGSVNVEGSTVGYDAVAGTLIVHPQGWDDATAKAKDKDNDNNPDAEAAMFFVAYFKHGADPAKRPITFLYNGGPGSATVWLHMGAFGPRRVVTANDTHTPAAPYNLVNNSYSLLDASDLVFIDAPGTGFSRIAGKDKEKAFWGVDEDANAFANFITQFLSKYGRWNSPKYLFGESYGTVRNAALVNILETGRDIDFNGVIMLSQCLNYDLGPDGPEFNPGVDLPYVLALPTYAATAWYHHKLPGNPGDLNKLLGEAQHFAMGDYAAALQAGAALNTKQRNMIAAKLHQYTGLPVSYILKADLRIGGGEFEKNLQDANDITTGRLDTRFSGPTMDPLSKEADYDPQSAAISSAYVSAFNDYARKQLHFGQDKEYKPEPNDPIKSWNFLHQPPGAGDTLQQSPNVIPDLSTAMKYNPDLKVMLNAGYFDLATPYYEGVYEMRHLQIPRKLQSNIEIKFYRSGHMVYANEDALKELHDNVADFIRQTDNQARR
jgi:carboxypeptidase C (cathepsin A)